MGYHRITQKRQNGSEKLLIRGDSAQAILGICYEKGRGVAKNHYTAVFWYRKAAEQGNKFAQCNLGTCYFKGNGVPEDKREAVKWFRKAAMQSNNIAMTNLGICYLYGHGVNKNRNEAVKWLRKAEKIGDKNATKYLNLLQRNKIAE